LQEEGHYGEKNMNRDKQFIEELMTFMSESTMDRDELIECVSNVYEAIGTRPNSQVMEILEAAMLVHYKEFYEGVMADVPSSQQATYDHHLVLLLGMRLTSNILAYLINTPIGLIPQRLTD
jgi:hypothetical protein